MCSLFSRKYLFSIEILPDYCTPRSGFLLSSYAVTSDRLNVLTANAASRRARGSMSAICALFVRESIHSVRSVAVPVLFQVAVLIIKHHSGKN